MGRRFGLEPTCGSCQSVKADLRREIASTEAGAQKSGFVGSSVTSHRPRESRLTSTDLV